MRIAIASGKGGVGKTTLAVALAVTASRQGRAAVYADCDVEAPNGHLLLRPAIKHHHPITRLIPEVDFDICRRCGNCESVCQFGAIVCLATTVQVNANLCKSCGACVAACPNQAISEVPHPAGYVQAGHVDSLDFVQGVLDVGQARSIPVINGVKAAISPEAELVILDAPPGTACPMVSTVRHADLVVLVAEATAFGLADLTIAVDAVQKIGVPVAVVINRSDLGDSRVREFCEIRKLPVLAEIPYSQTLAEGYAIGDLNRVLDALGDTTARLLDRLSRMPLRRAS